MKYLKIALSILIFLGGVALGIIIRDYPVLTLNKEVKITDVLSLILTATIAILIPFFIKRWIEDNRHVKNSINDELKETLKEVERIRDKIRFCYNRNNISKSDKDEINCFFEESDLKVNCLNELFIASYDNETKKIREEIQNSYINYWKCVTGNEVMSSRFNTINPDFYKRHNEIFSKFEGLIKMTITKIHRL